MHVEHETGSVGMAMLTIRGLDPVVKQRLRVRAAQRGNSMEEEARCVLSESCGGARAKNLAEIALRLFGDVSGTDLELPPRQKGREPPSLG
jgi:plasmid stability protein